MDKTLLESLKKDLLRALEILGILRAKQDDSITRVYPPPKYLWNTKENTRRSVRTICDEEGLTVEQKNTLTATIQCESGFNTKAVNQNKKDGKVMSTDFGICQINSYYHIGVGKSFPTSDFVINNPEACVRWMCKMWKAGKADLWVCHSKKMYLKYL